MIDSNVFFFLIFVFFPDIRKNSGIIYLSFPTCDFQIWILGKKMNFNPLGPIDYYSSDDWGEGR